MRERVRQLGGQTNIQSDGSGTTVTAELPSTLIVSELPSQEHNREKPFPDLRKISTLACPATVTLFRNRYGTPLVIHAYLPSLYP
jgi:hypothetical protein